MGFHCSSIGKESACSAGDPGSIPGLGRPPGKGNGNPLQSSCLDKCTDRGAWLATVCGVARVGYDLVTKSLYMYVCVFCVCVCVYVYIVSYISCLYVLEIYSHFEDEGNRGTKRLSNLLISNGAKSEPRWP